MKTRTVAYATHALSPITVISGANHQRSVRNVFAAMAARARTPRGFVADDVIRVVSLTGPCHGRRNTSGRHADGRTRTRLPRHAHTNDRTGVPEQLSDTRYADLGGPSAQGSVPCVPLFGKPLSMINIRVPGKDRQTVNRRRRR
ncbi:hypothetical protein Vse01_47810 [Micromonospora sediminimaris]|uniref:Uncharacterized protein n=1 Tax=Micromonospora sediminimaris TaxID=547162 RepID=A0A9W5UWM3_9ACTN|nr:hypothetical protein Vse01_47810 [Micromonospora sediminimaris]